MQTLFRASIMLGAIGAIYWAVREFGPENTIQPVSRRVVMLVDHFLAASAEQDEEMAGRSIPTGDSGPSLRLIADARESEIPLDATATPANLGSEEHPKPLAAPLLSAHVDQEVGTGTECEVMPIDTVSAVPSLVRLDQLGAKSITLGQWGSFGSLYRSSCQIPTPDLPAGVSHFNAISETAAGAVQELLGQVEAWQSKRELMARK